MRRWINSFYASAKIQNGDCFGAICRGHKLYEFVWTNLCNGPIELGVLRKETIASDGSTPNPNLQGLKPRRG
jgi:hypothetical protein